MAKKSWKLGAHQITGWEQPRQANENSALRKRDAKKRNIYEHLKPLE